MAAVRPYLSTLVPLPACVGGGDIIRSGGSKLAALFRFDWSLFGMGGTGGATGAMFGLPFVGPGEGDRNVRSVIEPPLFCLWSGARSAPPLGPFPRTLPLSIDDCEPRLIIRLVCMLPGGSGDDVADRSAAAAAADDRADEGAFVRFRKAALAATVALVLVDRFTG